MQTCKCANGTTVTRGVKPPADCSSNRTTGCEGCCDGGVLDTGGRIVGTNRGVRSFITTRSRGRYQPSQGVIRKTGDHRRFSNIKRINRNIYNI